MLGILSHYFLCIMISVSQTFRLRMSITLPYLKYYSRVRGSRPSQDSAHATRLFPALAAGTLWSCDADGGGSGGGLCARLCAWLPACAWLQFCAWILGVASICSPYTCAMRSSDLSESTHKGMPGLVPGCWADDRPCAGCSVGSSPCEVPSTDLAATPALVLGQTFSPFADSPHSSSSPHRSSGHTNLSAAATRLLYTHATSAIAAVATLPTIAISVPPSETLAPSTRALP